jgi:hypothetical protein
MRKYYRVKEDRNILYTVKRTQANWIGHTFRRNWFIKYVIEKKIEGGREVTGRRGRRRR